MPRNLFTSMATPPPLYRTQTELPPRPVANACSAAMITALAGAAAAFDVAAKNQCRPKCRLQIENVAAYEALQHSCCVLKLLFLFLLDLYSVWSYPVLCSHDRQSQIRQLPPFAFALPPPLCPWTCTWNFSLLLASFTRFSWCGFAFGVSFCCQIQLCRVYVLAWVYAYAETCMYPIFHRHALELFTRMYVCCCYLYTFKERHE